MHGLRHIESLHLHMELIGVEGDRESNMYEMFF